MLDSLDCWLSRSAIRVKEKKDSRYSVMCACYESENRENIGKANHRRNFSL